MMAFTAGDLVRTLDDTLASCVFSGERPDSLVGLYVRTVRAPHHNIFAELIIDGMRVMTAIDNIEKL